MSKLFEFLRSALPNIEHFENLATVSGVGPAWIFGAFGTVAVSLFGLSMGRTRAIISLLSLYFAFALERIFPFIGNIRDALGGNPEIYWLRTGVFIGAYILVFSIFSISLIKKRISSMEFSLPGILLLSFIQLGFAASIIFNILPEEIASQWLNGFYVYFASPVSLFVWAVLPLPILFFIKK